MEREIAAALDELGAGWVEIESQGAEFGDKRLNQRYARVLERMSRMPQAPFNQSCEDLAEMLAAYRFIDNQKVTVERLLSPHREQVAERAQGEKTLLLVQDTTYLDFNDHFACEDLRPLRLKKLQRALWVHATLCLLPNGLPLGVANVQFLTGHFDWAGPKSLGSHRPMSDRQTRRYLDAVDQCGAIGESARKVWISDREADIYEFLDHVRSKGEDYLVRSKHRREIEEGPWFDLIPAIEHAPISGCYELCVAKSGPNPARKAKMAVRYCSATICAPRHKTDDVHAESIPSFIVETFEVDPPAGVEPIHWRLVTSLKVASHEDALRIVSWYQKRWAIEELFKILKSGCRAEKAQFHKTVRLAKYTALSLIVAWRIYYLVHLNRIAPNSPACCVLTGAEIATLQLLANDKRRATKQRRTVIKTARQAITHIARLGGYLNRKSDPHPGTVVLWKGTMALAFSTMTFLAQQRAANQ